MKLTRFKKQRKISDFLCFDFSEEKKAFVNDGNLWYNKLDYIQFLYAQPAETG